jgi:hypothetical protein
MSRRMRMRMTFGETPNAATGTAALPTFIEESKGHGAIEENPCF